MIFIIEALEWINAFDISHINKDSRACLEEMTRITVKNAQASKNILPILDKSRVSVDSLDYPEALLHVGAVEFLRGWKEEGKAHIYQAYTLYPPRGHRRAVAAWILGIVEWQFRENEAAQFHWREAYDYFSAILYDYQSLLSQVRNTQYTDTRKREIREHNVQGKVNWYQEILDRLQIEMCKKVEEVFTWLEIFEPFHLSISSREFRDIFRDKLEKNLYPSANLLIQEIQKHSLDHAQYIETPELLLECGIAAYQTGNLQIAIDLVEKAVSRFPPDSHCQAISRWMSGAIQWLIPNRYEKARRCWQMCIDDIEKMIRMADIEDRQDRRHWYAVKVKIMKAALADMLKDVYSEEGKAVYPNWENG